MKKKSACALFLLLLVNLSYAQDFFPGDLQSILEGNSVDESIDFEEIEGLIFLKARINASETYFRFLLDTGAPSGISPEVVGQIHPKMGKKVLVKSSGAKDDSLGLALLDSVKIGGLCFKQIIAFVADFRQGEIMKCYQIDGIIGGNLMATAIWQIDKLKKQIRICKQINDLDYIRKAYQMDFELYGWQKSPLLNLDINHKKIHEKVMFDTGYGGFFSWSRNTFYQALRRNMLESDRILKGRGTSVETIFGKDVDSVVYNVQLKNMMLGKINFQEPIVDVDLDQGSKLGAKLLDQFVVTLDFLHQRMYAFDRRKTAPKTQLESFGFSAYIRDTDIYVTLLWENSPATQAGMHLYDRIIEINGVSFRQIDAYNKCLLFLQLRDILYKNQEINILFASEGETHTARIRKEILLGSQ